MHQPTASDQNRRTIHSQIQKLWLQYFRPIDALDTRELNKEHLTDSEQLLDLRALQDQDQIVTLEEVTCSLSKTADYSLFVELEHPTALNLEDNLPLVSISIRSFRPVDALPTSAVFS